MIRAVMISALAGAACGDNLEPRLAAPDASEPITIAQWSTIGIAAPSDVRTAWDPDRQVLVTATSYATWERIGERWEASPAFPVRPPAGLFFDENRHQIGALSESVAAPLASAIASSWNGVRWSGLTQVSVTGIPAAVVFDPRRDRPLLFTIANGAQLDAYTYGEDAVGFLGALEAPLFVDSVRATYDRATDSALVAGVTGVTDESSAQSIVCKFASSRWSVVPFPVDLAVGFAMGTVDDHAELVVAGTVYRFDGTAFTVAVDGLPVVGRPTALWQTRDGERHVLYPTAEFRLHDGAWVETPLLTDSDALAIAVAPAGDHLDLFASGTDPLIAASKVERWRLADGVVTLGTARAAPRPRRGAIAVYSTGRSAIVYGGGAILPSDVFAFDGDRFSRIASDLRIAIGANAAAYDPAATFVAAISTDPTDGAASPRLATLADDARAWSVGPALPSNRVVDASLAYDAGSVHVVAAQRIGEDPFTVAGTEVRDLVGGAWVLDAEAPQGGYVLATDEQYGSIVTIEEAFDTASYERRDGLWARSTSLPLAFVSVVGTAYDPVHHDLVVLAKALGGTVLMVRHRD